MTVICTVDLPDEEEIDLTDTNGLDEICAKCGGPEDFIPENWLCCERCQRWLHRACCGVDLSGIDWEAILNFPYELITVKAVILTLNIWYDKNQIYIVIHML